MQVPWLDTAILAVIALELAYIILVWTAHLEAIRDLLSRPQSPPWPLHHEHFDMKNYCIWSYRDGRWVLVEDRSGEGYHSGPPPERPGGYPGESLRRPSRPRM